MERVELLWKEKSDNPIADFNEKAFALSDLLGIDMINEETIDDIADASDDII